MADRLVEAESPAESAAPRSVLPRPKYGRYLHSAGNAIGSLRRGLAIALIGKEGKGMVLEDGSADGPSELILMIGTHLG